MRPLPLGGERGGSVARHHPSGQRRGTPVHGVGNREAAAVPLAPGAGAQKNTVCAQQPPARGFQPPHSSRLPRLARQSQRGWYFTDGMFAAAPLAGPGRCLPPILHPLIRVAGPNYSQAQQGLLSPLTLPSPFPWLCFRWAAGWDSRNLVNPFMHVTN